MIRTPLRPLARILDARARGENPDRIEAENRRRRREEARDSERTRAEGRLFLLGLGFLCAFVTIGLRMAHLAATDPVEPRTAAAGPVIVASRADITDRHGRLLATNLSTHSLYAHPQDMIDPARAARELSAIFPDMDADALARRFTSDLKFIWLRRTLSPEQVQAVHDIGEPGLLFGPREMRLYPNGTLAAHILGGAGFGLEGVDAAEVIGTAGVEKAFDTFLRDPANKGAPLRLSIDLTVQAAMRQILWGGMRLMNAKGASAVLMDIHTGEILAMVSLPDFDPNDRPRPLTEGDAADSPLFNRAVQGVYELGSVFKIFTAAQAVELGLVNPDTVIDTSPPYKVGRFAIGEFQNKNYGRLSVTDIIVKSSNRGTGRLAQMIGGKRQRDFLQSLGFFEPTPLEMVEAPTGKPLLPKQWSEISTVTVSYGHGLSTSPVHLAAAYATIAGGGTRVTPTLLKRDRPEPGPRIVSEETSKAVREMLRAVVARGTASFGEVPGYSVGGKTGTADKPRRGGYDTSSNITTFASVFPTTEPAYVLILTLDEPSDNSGETPRRTAGWTAVPVAAEVIRRTAPLLGLRPIVEQGPEAAIRRTSY